MHESDGHVIIKKVALKVVCRDFGHAYIFKLKTESKCPECGCKEYDIKDEIYE